MTKAEAIDLLGRLIRYCDPTECPHGDCDKCIEAINMAEEALKGNKMNKCEQCKWLAGKISSVGIECVNPNKMFRNTGSNEVSHYKNLTTKACTKFEEGTNIARERWEKYQLEKRDKRRNGNQ